MNSVSGPGMLDFLLVFNLPKLVFDDEMCGQALRFVREVRVADDLPVDALIDQLMADQHLIMADAHDGALADASCTCPSSIVDRDNRENWLKAGGKDTYQRAIDEVDRRLAAYRPVETDPAIDAELQRIIRPGLSRRPSCPGCRRRRSRPRRRWPRSRRGRRGPAGRRRVNPRRAGGAE